MGNSGRIRGNFFIISPISGLYFGRCQKLAPSNEESLTGARNIFHKRHLHLIQETLLVFRLGISGAGGAGGALRRHARRAPGDRGPGRGRDGGQPDLDGGEGRSTFWNWHWK